MNDAIESALRQSHCTDGHQPCQGVIVIGPNGTTLACKLCGNEKLKPNDPKPTGNQLQRRAILYRAVVKEMSETL